MRPNWGWLLLGLVLAGAGAWWLLGGPPVSPPPQPAPLLPVAPVQTVAAALPASAASLPDAAALQQSPSPPVLSDDIAAHIPPGREPSMAEVIAGLRERGIRGGLAAFNPPGTRPPLIGLAVPEDFELPPGFVRHHQATDDGQRIEAVLMFAPDHRLFDANGREVPLPANRLVPPEWAPPGLPLRRITVPPPAAEGRP